MSEPSLWSALHDAPAALVPHARVYRHTVRGERWAVLHNGLNGEQVRINEAALDTVLALDGERDVAAVLAEHCPDADATVHEALAGTLLTLEAAGLLRLGRADDTTRLVERVRRRARRRAFDPLAVRLPLHDPDAWLSRLTPRLTSLQGALPRASLALLVALTLAIAFGSAGQLLAELGEVASSPTIQMYRSLSMLETLTARLRTPPPTRVQTGLRSSTWAETPRPRTRGRFRQTRLANPRSATGLMTIKTARLTRA